MDPKQLPAWLKPEDLDHYATEYLRTRFRGGLNWYRAQDIFWEETPCSVVEFARPYVDNLGKSVPNLWKKVLLPGVGHWTEQEAQGSKGSHRFIVQLG